MLLNYNVNKLHLSALGDVQTAEMSAVWTSDSWFVKGLKMNKNNTVIITKNNPASQFLSV